MADRNIEAQVAAHRHAMGNPRFTADSAYHHYDYDPSAATSGMMSRWTSTVLPALFCSFNVWWVAILYWVIVAVYD